MSDSSRRDILSRLRAVDVPDPGLPAAEVDAIQYADLVEQFGKAIVAVGGSVVHIGARDSQWSALQQLDVYRQSARIAATTDWPLDGQVDVNAIADPHALHDIDLFIAQGEFGVAENGAIWVTDRGLRHRVLFFLAQHLVLILANDQIVHTMHAAYDRMTLGHAEFGAFISGPSKTADIEQSLVIGAHGARSLTVLLCDV